MRKIMAEKDFEPTFKNWSSMFGIMTGASMDDFIKKDVERIIEEKRQEKISSFDDGNYELPE